MNSKEREKLIGRLVNETSTSDFLDLMDDVIGLEYFTDKAKELLQDREVWTDEKLLELKERLLWDYYNWRKYGIYDNCSN